MTPNTPNVNVGTRGHIDHGKSPMEIWLSTNYSGRMYPTIAAAWDAGVADTVKMYEPILQDHNRLVRELDECINGEDGSARQASLSDIVSQVRREGLATDRLISALYLYLGSNLSNPDVVKQCHSVAQQVIDNTPESTRYSLVQHVIEHSVQLHDDLADYIKFLEAQHQESLRFIMEQKTTIAALTAQLESPNE